jgi:hypothetical protein
LSAVVSEGAFAFEAAFAVATRMGTLELRRACDEAPAGTGVRLSIIKTGSIGEDQAYGTVFTMDVASKVIICVNTVEQGEWGGGGCWRFKSGREDAASSSCPFSNGYLFVHLFSLESGLILALRFLIGIGFIIVVVVLCHEAKIDTAFTADNKAVAAANELPVW